MSVTLARRKVGWLLRTNRRLGGNGDLRSGREFARAFRRDGGSLSPSQVTRWENGETPPTRAAVRRYEHLLGLRREMLVTIADAIVRAESTDAHRVEAVDDSTTGDGRLHGLLDRATAGEMTGAAWSELTGLVQTRPGLVLHPTGLWRTIAERLLAEMVVSEDIAWLQRQESMSRLLDHSQAGPHVVRACIALADDPSSPVTIEPMSLLDVTGHPDASAYLVRQIVGPDNERAMHGALLASIRKVRCGHFTDVQLKRLVAALTGAMAEPSIDQTLLPLMVDLGRALARRTPGAAALHRALPVDPVAHRVWDTRRTGEAMVVRGVSARIAARTQAGGCADAPGSDEVLVLLVEDALYSPNPDERLFASLLVGATPYREPFARALLTEVTTELSRRGDVIPAIGLRALTLIRSSLHRPLLQDILVRPESNTALRHAAAWATPHCAGRFAVPVWRRILTCQLQAWVDSPSTAGEEVLHGITYGIGTDDHRGLLAEMRDDPRVPARARTTANWLLDAPATMREGKTHPAPLTEAATQVTTHPTH